MLTTNYPILTDLIGFVNLGRVAITELLMFLSADNYSMIACQD